MGKAKVKKRGKRAQKSIKKDEKEKLKAKLEAFCGHTVIMECSSNSAILGGVIVHIDGKVLDGSLRRRLRDIKEKIET